MPGFISSHGGGSETISSQKSAQRGAQKQLSEFFGLKIWSPKSHGKNQLKPFSDIFESKSEVSLVQKKIPSGTRKHVGFSCL